MSTVGTDVPVVFLFFFFSQLTCLGLYSFSSSFHTVLNILAQNEINLGDNKPMSFQQTFKQRKQIILLALHSFITKTYISGI